MNEQPEHKSYLEIFRFQRNSILRSFGFRQAQISLEFIKTLLIAERFHLMSRDEHIDAFEYASQMRLVRWDMAMPSNEISSSLNQEKIARGLLLTRSFQL